jgi:glycosyltransferase 2 family protein
MTNRQRSVIALGLIISVVCMALAFNGLKPVDVIASIQQANGWLLLAAAVWYLASRIVIALRWWFLLRSTQVIPVMRLLEMICIGYMGNNVYPLRAGEILRVLLLRREYGVPIVRSTTIVLAERLFDGIVLLSFVLLAALTLDIGSPEVEAVISLAAPVFGAALVVFFALALNPTLFRRVVRLVTDRLPGAIGGRLAGMADHVIDGCPPACRRSRHRRTRRAAHARRSVRHDRHVVWDMAAGSRDLLAGSGGLRSERRLPGHAAGGRRGQSGRADPGLAWPVWGI